MRATSIVSALFSFLVPLDGAYLLATCYLFESVFENCVSKIEARNDEQQQTRHEFTRPNRRRRRLKVFGKK